MPVRILVFSASPRFRGTCPGEDGKTLDIAKKAMNGTREHHDVVFDFENLSVRGDGKYVIQPCKGCVSTSNYHCGASCDCYGPGSAGEGLPDVMHDNKIYDRMIKADGFAFFTPINWNSGSSNLKLMMDRLVCASEALPADFAKQVFKNRKDPKETAAAAAQHMYDDQLTNMLEGRYAAFFVHGDAGADDFQRRDPPKSYRKDRFPAFKNPATAVEAFVDQMTYSGVFVPEGLVVGVTLGKDKSYAQNNEDYYDNPDDVIARATSVLSGLVVACENAKGRMLRIEAETMTENALVQIRR